MRIRRNFGSGEGVRGSRLFLVERRSERSRTERMWEPDRSQESKGVRGAKGQGNKGIRRAKGARRAKGTIEDKEDGGPSLFLHQIIDFASVETEII